jgi:23S rRNA pseudouridine1911/1915/1917 synthase
VVVNKPPGLLVEPLPGKAAAEVTVLDLVNDELRHQTAAPCQVVHRIDRDTSGLVLLARTSAARDFLKAQFADHLPERVYQALVLGVPQPGAGDWHDRLAWDGDSLRQRRAHGTDARAKDARCRYRVVETLGDVSRLEVSLITGKRNQIRVQAGLRGHALVGEQQYRFATPEEPADLPSLRRQALHAWRLVFVHPATGETCRFEAPWPADFAGVLEALRRRQQTA